MKNYFTLFRKKPSRQIMITIPEPCGEVWSQMKPVDDCHRHCAACDRVLTDFSLMNDDELMLFFHQSNGKVCGRFRKDQLNRPLVPLPPRATKARWWKAALLLPFTLFAKSSSAQDSTRDTIPVVQTDSTLKVAEADSIMVSDSVFTFNWMTEMNDGGPYLYAGGVPMILMDFVPPTCTVTYTVTVSPPTPPPNVALGAAPAPTKARSKDHTGKRAGKGFRSMSSPDSE